MYKSQMVQRINPLYYIIPFLISYLASAIEGAEIERGENSIFKEMAEYSDRMFSHGHPRGLARNRR